MGKGLLVLEEGWLLRGVKCMLPSELLPKSHPPNPVSNEAACPYGASRIPPSLPCQNDSLLQGAPSCLTLGHIPACIM